MKTPDRYHRQTLLAPIGIEGQKKIRAARIMIVGAGALGSCSSELLTRMGVHSITLIDRDIVDFTNLHRQMLYDEIDAQQQTSKVEAAIARLSQINSDVEFVGYAIDLDTTNIEGLFNDVHPDLVIDGTDNAETRYLLNDVCVKRQLPWVMGAAVGVEGRVGAFVPGGPCLRCVFPKPPDVGELPSCDTVGVMPSLVTLVASMQVTEALRILMKDESAARELTTIELWTNRIRTIDIHNAKRDDCPCCVKRAFDFLNNHAHSTAKLCGRNAVQVRPARPARLNLEDLSNRLRGLGAVDATSLMLKFSPDDRPDLSACLFNDGRMILFGSEDRTLARTLYAKYVGV